MTKNIFISSDHGGYELKEKIIHFLNDNKLNVSNLGTNSNESVDYPDFCKKLVNELRKNKDAFGVLICGTGIGMSIAANRYKHIRAALCTDDEMALLSRKHNDANVLILGGRTTSFKSAKKMINIFLKTSFDSGRHTLRLKKI